MDDDSQVLPFLEVPTYLVISSLLEVAGCLLVVLACLTVLRRGLPAAAALVGAVLAGVATALTLAAYGSTAGWSMSDRFWELTTYSRALGLALLALALLLALLRSRRVRE